jgi:hypothetical protein
MNRRSFIQLLIGVIASLGGLSVLTFVRQDRCLDAGGQWAAATRTCAGAAGPIDVARASDFVLALGVGVLLAFMLYRASTFASRRASRPD